MEECPICRIPHPFQDIVALRCGCKGCREGLSEWLRQQLHTGQSDIVCAGEKRHPVLLTELQALVPIGLLAALEYREIVKALCHVEVKTCPNPSCGYIGWTDLPIFCLSAYQCGKCGQQWTDHSVPHWFHLPSELCSELWKDLVTNSCPNCLFPIEKRGGCSHMTCIKCSYQFCWDCSQDYVSHYAGTCNLVTACKYGPAGVLVGFFGVKWVSVVTPQLWMYVSFLLFPGFVALLAYCTFWAWAVVLSIFREFYQERRALWAILASIPLSLETYWLLPRLIAVLPQVFRAVVTLVTVLWGPVGFSGLVYCNLNS